VTSPKVEKAMAINAFTTVVGVTPRLSQARFATILRQRGSPAAGEASPEDAWDLVRQQGVDPAFALAIFHQESQFGTDAASATAQFGLRNAGHTRTSRIGVGHQVDTPWGPFIRYPSWSEGWRDLAFRLVDPEFFYARQGRRTIRPIIELWAPPDDIFDVDGLNNTERYVRNVVHNMTDWIDLADGGTPTTVAEPCPLAPPPPFDGSDKQVGDVVFHAAAQTVQVVQEGLRCRQFADPTSCETRGPLHQGDTFEALYWVEGQEVAGERRWWVARSGSRIWSGGTIQRPGETR
jgi:hypothetical protein